VSWIKYKELMFKALSLNFPVFQSLKRAIPNSRVLKCPDKMKRTDVTFGGLVPIAIGTKGG